MYYTQVRASIQVEHMNEMAALSTPYHDTLMTSDKDGKIYKIQNQEMKTLLQELKKI